MPTNVPLERAVLATLLIGTHATAMHKVGGVIPHPLVFYERDHRFIYMACLDLDRDGHRIDASAVGEWLGRLRFDIGMERLRQQEQLQESRQLDRMSRAQLAKLYRFRDEDRAQQGGDSVLDAIGGYGRLVDLTGEFAPASGLERNAFALLDLYLKRNLILRLSLLSDKARLTTDSFQDMVDESSTAVLELSALQPQGDILSADVVVDQAVDTIGQAIDGQTVGGVSTGFAQVDDALMRLRNGGLYILAARPGVGKTSFALKLAQNIAGSEQGMGVLFFSLEVDATDLMKKVLSGLADVEFRKIENGQLDEAEFAAVQEAAQQIRDWRFDLMDISDLNIGRLRSLVRRRKLEAPDRMSCIIIDYLQLLQGSRRDMNEYEKVSEISRTLKVVARELEVPVIALSQMSRDVEKSAQQKPREPRLSDLRGSGSIEQDADAVLFLHRVDLEQNLERDVKLIIAKNRFGPMGSADLIFLPARQNFVERHGGGAQPYSEVLDNGDPDGDDDLFA